MKSSICNKIFEDVIKTYHKEDDVNAIISNPILGLILGFRMISSKCH